MYWHECRKTITNFQLLYLECCRRDKERASHPSTQKIAMTVKMLKAIVEDSKKNYSMANIWLTSACLLVFPGYLSWIISKCVS